mmetsp:Transcript_9318/g.39550  ORF Transcript_9318/g.39550 Transcript_9318/m.39550 type:complete len:342 (+) Transcript_9318:1409-2434(+)
MRPDDNLRLAAFPPFHHLFALALLDVAGHELDARAERAESRRDRRRVLLREHGGGRQHEHLPAAGEDAENRAHRNLRLPEPNVAHHDAVHRRVPGREVLVAVVHGHRLVGRELEREQLPEPFIHLRRGGLVRLAHALQPLQVHAHLVHHELPDVFFRALLLGGPALAVLDARQLGGLHAGLERAGAGEAIQLRGGFLRPDLRLRVRVLDEQETNLRRGPDGFAGGRVHGRGVHGDAPDAQELADAELAVHDVLARDELERVDGVVWGQPVAAAGQKSALHSLVLLARRRRLAENRLALLQPVRQGLALLFRLVPPQRGALRARARELIEHLLVLELVAHAR